MTDILPWLIANGWLLAIALAFLIFLVAGVSWAFAWYFWRWVIKADREPEALLDAFGDVIHVPEKAKRRAA